VPTKVAHAREENQGTVTPRCGANLSRTRTDAGLTLVASRETGMR